MFGITREEGETKTARPSDMWVAKIYWMWNSHKVLELFLNASMPDSFIF